MKTKICTKCHIEKLLLEFVKSNRIKLGYLSICKICKILINKKYIRAKCINCEKKLSDNRAKRCNKCFQLDILNPNYVNGKTNKKHFCIKCGKSITYNAKTNMCLKCAAKYVIAPKISGKKSSNYGKSVNWKLIKYKNIYMRSTWEANFAKWLDLSGIKWEYEPKAFELKINGKDTTYTPDFYLPEFDCYIEIKGWWRNDAKEKFLKFQKLNKIKLFDKVKLSIFGII